MGSLKARELSVAVEMKTAKNGVRYERLPDEIDQVGHNMENIINISRLDRLTRIMRTILEARSRLESGEYGECQNCDEMIAPARLRAIPEAEFCIRCEEQKEQNLLHEPDEVPENIQV